MACIAMKKRDVCRPYPPQYASAETAAYLLDCSRAKFDADVRSGLLPKPIKVGTLSRWRWSDVEAAIEAQNGLALNGAAAPSSEDDDPFLRGVRRVEAQDA
jgi:predicted DNA-binding transcriptional regulator AlpA